MKRILVNISKDGSKVTVETDGYRGAACKEASEALLGALGETVSNKEKAEFYQDPLPPRGQHVGVSEEDGDNS